MRVVKDAEERRNEILDAAEKLFAERGYDHTSTNDLIEVVGIARGTLYHHFRSKEDILDAMIDRIERQLLSKAKGIAGDRSRPVLERITQTMLSLNVESPIGIEVMEQIHKPQNALLHQKLQERLIEDVVPVFAGLVEEGIAEQIFSTPVPREASEMILIYSNIAFDDLTGLTPEQQINKITAFIYNTERVLGAKEGSLSEAILPIFGV